jgi:hypothetical protein
MPQRYEDVSNWGTPYDGHIFDGFYMGGLGADAETPGPVKIPETTVYGQCDFTAGPYVSAVQKYLVDKGALTAAAAAADQGFGEATCQAWKVHFGSPPSAAALASGFLKPNETCASLVLPGCAAEGAAEGFSPAKLLLYGAGLVGILVVAKAWR